jgi:hypothetical protein
MTTAAAQVTTPEQNTPPPSLMTPPSGASVAPPAPPAAAPPAPAAGASWRDSLPEELKASPQLQKYGDVSELAKAYVNAERLIGSDKIPIPGKHATESDWNAFYQKLGRPETSDKYDIKLPEGSKVDDKLVVAFKEAAHKAGMLPKQAQGVMDWWAQTSKARVEEMNTQMKAAHDKEIGALKAEWGEAFDREIDTARVAIAEFGDGSLGEWLTKSGLDTHPQMIRLMNRIGKSLAEDKIQGNGSTANMGVTPAEAQSRINSMMADRNGPYYDSSHPNHKAAVAEMQELYGKLSSGR